MTHSSQFHGFRSSAAGPGVFEAASRPTPTEQLAILNAALTAEVLRHAEARVRLAELETRAISWSLFQIADEGAGNA